MVRRGHREMGCSGMAFCRVRARNGYTRVEFCIVCIYIMQNQIFSKTTVVPTAAREQ
jgi:hypothetical protein